VVTKMGKGTGQAKRAGTAKNRAAAPRMQQHANREKLYGIKVKVQRREQI